MIAVNLGGVDGLRRCPRMVFDLGESEDLTKQAEALPKLVAVGFSIPKHWAQEKANIPLPLKGEDVLTVAPAVPANNAPAIASVILPPGIAALSTLPAAPAPSKAKNPVDSLDTDAAPLWQQQLDQMRSLVEDATTIEGLQDELLQSFGGAPQEVLVRLMSAAFALAELKGMADVQEDR